jgi:hypothetical protein
MHFSINTADSQSEIEKLGHTITKHHLNKLLLPNKKEILLNVLTASTMATQKTIVT